jgi:hypothetical protein
MVATGAPDTPLNEITQYQNCKCITSSESVWRILRFDTNDNLPPVQALSVHLPDKQNVAYKQGQEIQAVAHAKSSLLGWFAYNTARKPLEPGELLRLRPLAGKPTYMYCDMPAHCTYDKKLGEWNERQRAQKHTMVGRIYTINIRAGDVFYLRMLILDEHSKGACSFKDLLTIDGHTYETFEAVCRALGKLQSNDEWIAVLEEAAFTQFSQKIQNLFVLILAYNNPPNPLELFERFAEDMSSHYETR